MLILLLLSHNFAHPSLLGKLNKFKQRHLEFYTMVLIATTKLFLINGQVHKGSKTSWNTGLEVFKTLDNLNAAFMEEIFHRRKWLTLRPNNIQANVYKTAKDGDKSLRTLVPHIWNSLPEHMKAERNFIKFREYIN